ncbi:hypothetical protein NPIL_514761 [Nephila pilipes]|uniref:Uncharacterized protein n=1 Tax=Nephila pilipes TaxID=299642 RepID=A0A8X6U664_NEPPI|nr:hypothetical protein NPIL_514761 [Nephila pilipes]
MTLFPSFYLLSSKINVAYKKRFPDRSKEIPFDNSYIFHNRRNTKRKEKTSLSLSKKSYETSELLPTQNVSLITNSRKFYTAINSGTFFFFHFLVSVDQWLLFLTPPCAFGIRSVNHPHPPALAKVLLFAPSGEIGLSS